MGRSQARRPCRCSRPSRCSREQRRVVVVLRYGLGYPPAAIAELLDLPPGTVHSRLARALEELRAHVEVSDVPRA